MKLVGLTGGIGTGKSTVSAMLRELGATIIDADEAARAVVEPGTEGFDAVVHELGTEFVSDGRLDRQKIAGLVFADEDARRRLNAITHPLVRVWMAERQAEAAERGDPVVVLDVPLLFESGLDSALPEVVVVWTPAEVQVQRLMEGRGFEEADARARIASQLPIDVKRERAGHVIDNSGSREHTRRQVEALWQRLR